MPDQPARISRRALTATEKALNRLRAGKGTAEDIELLERHIAHLYRIIGEFQAATGKAHPTLPEW